MLKVCSKASTFWRQNTIYGAVLMFTKGTKFYLEVIRKLSLISS
ncbi:hypothetical protein LDDCCGHA_5041 [Methylobacterium oxalidis]|nr:hypothetical protein LDDCCGHA_5041 [Methylobacterium oxalidis]